MNGLFAGLFGDILGETFGLGTYPEPPDSVVLRILGLEAKPMTQEAVKSAFRTRLKQIHPDVAVYENTPLLHAAGAVASQRPEVQELAWARDVLLRKVPPPSVTGAGSPPDHVRHPSRWQPSPCAKCGGPRVNEKGRITGPQRGRFEGWCLNCAREGANADRRQRRRVTRLCAMCPQWFTPPRSDALYCSPACRQKAYRQRHRDDNTTPERSPA